MPASVTEPDSARASAGEAASERLASGAPPSAFVITIVEAGLELPAPATAQLPHTVGDLSRAETDLLVPVITEAIERSGLSRREIGFTVSGSCDFVVGRPFSFVMALDAVGAWPPIAESHVEMDGAFALYEAWTRLQS